MGMTFLLPRVQVLLERCVWRTTQAFGLEQFLEAIMNGLRLAKIPTFKSVRFCTLIGFPCTLGKNVTVEDASYASWCRLEITPS